MFDLPESIAVVKENNIKRQFSAKHANYASNLSLWEREEKSLKLWLAYCAQTVKAVSENVPVRRRKRLNLWPLDYFV